ncbi:MAG: CoA pyrophosphatase [Thermomonas sp.]|uniref:CoA pyrophosphatase n=1 Tax=Thermomonas sp. TaxID=1971895 RepID=UPI002622AEBD|nr:CoA pyrophosphatase [Thermomonas sp.]MCC7095710.1 CoA pyrophosphatase [Thermomonas sp.]
MGPERLAGCLRQAVYPPETPPASPPWNLGDLEGLALDADPRPAAVLVGVIARPAGSSVLLTRRTEQLRHHAGQVSFPGGRIESSDASPVAAALREANEEIGLQSGQVRVLGYLDPYLTITGFQVLPVLALIRADFVARANPDEVADVFEVPLEYLLDPACLERIEINFGGRARHVLQYRYAAHRIWGATASILYNLRERLAGVEQGGT